MKHLNFSNKWKDSTAEKRAE